MREYDFTILLEVGFWVRLLHLAGTIMAVGAVTVTDSLLAVLHFRPRLAPLIARLTHVLSLVVWMGFFVLSVSGIYLVLANPLLLTDRAFQVKMILTAVVFINGVYMNLRISPRFEDLSDEWHRDTRRVNRFQIIAGIGAMVSLVGWWSIIVVVMFNRYQPVL